MASFALSVPFSYQPQGLCCCCCCCPGLGNTGTVSSCSNPPIVPCAPLCQPCPVAWFTNALWRKGFVLPVAWTCRGEAVLCGACGRAKGFVPVGCAWSGCGWGCWPNGGDCGCAMPFSGIDCCGEKAWEGDAWRAKGLVDCRCRPPPVLLRSGLPNAPPVGIMLARKGFVDCGCTCCADC